MCTENQHNIYIKYTNKNYVLNIDVMEGQCYNLKHKKCCKYEDVKRSFLETLQFYWINAMGDWAVF